MINAASMHDSRTKHLPSLLVESDGVRNDARFEAAESIRDELSTNRGLISNEVP